MTISAAPLLQRLLGHQGGRAPIVQLSSARRVFNAIHRANRKGLIQSCHDLSEGGLAVAAAEMAIAGGYGLEIDVRDVPVTEPGLADSTRLFAESPTRFLVEVTPSDAPALETLLGRTPHARIGRVLDSPQLRVSERRRNGNRREYRDIARALAEAIGGGRSMSAELVNGAVGAQSVGATPASLLPNRRAVVIPRISAALEECDRGRVHW